MLVSGKGYVLGFEYLIMSPETRLGIVPGLLGSQYSLVSHLQYRNSVLTALVAITTILSISQMKVCSYTCHVNLVTHIGEMLK